MIGQVTAPSSPPKSHITGDNLPRPLKPGAYLIKNVEVGFNLHFQDRDVTGSKGRDVASVCKDSDKHYWTIEAWKGRPGIYSLRYNGGEIFANCSDTDDARRQIIKDRTVVGRRLNRSPFEISQCGDVGNCYTIKVAGSKPGLFWSLADDQIGTPVTLDKSAAKSRCQWFFEPIETPHSNTRKRSLSSGSDNASTVLRDSEDAEIRNEPPRKVARTISPGIPPDDALTVVSDTEDEQMYEPRKIARTVSSGFHPDDASTVVNDAEDEWLTEACKVERTMSPGIPPDDASTIASYTEYEEMTEPFKVERTMSPGIPPDDTSTVATISFEMSDGYVTLSYLNRMTPLKWSVQLWRPR